MITSLISTQRRPEGADAELRPKTLDMFMGQRAARKTQHVFAVLGGLALALTGCDSPVDEATLQTEAKKAIAAELPNPASAIFRNVRVPLEWSARINGIVCGEIDGTAEDGSRFGFRRFAFAKVADFAGIEEPKAKRGEVQSPEAVAYQREFDSYWSDNCQ